MNKLEIYDPAMCCSTGVCGPSVDPELVRMASDVESLLKKGADVKRYNLAQEPGAFAANPAIRELLQNEGPEVLPVTLVQGAVRKKQAYPTTAELSEWSGIPAGLPSIGRKPLKLLDVTPVRSESKDGGGCCEPGSGCC